MIERLLKFFPVLLLALLAALTYWLDKVVQGPAEVGKKALTHSPDFTVDKLLATRMDVNGRIRDSLQAAKMLHFPDDDSSEFEQPRFVSFSRGVPLSITSQRALVSSNGADVYFRDNVRATRAAQAGKGALVVATEYLHVVPDDNIAKTDRPVTISDNSMTIQAVGMELNSETRILTLHARVKGVFYDANSAKGRAGNSVKP